MRWLKPALGIFGISVLILSTGCADKGTLGQLTSNADNSDLSTIKKEPSNSNSEIELSPIATVRESFEENVNKIKERKFDNISFENTFFSFTDATELCTLEYESEITKFTWSTDEAYDYISKRVDEFFPGMYNDEEKNYEIRFADAKAVNKETAQGLYRWPNLDQYKEMNLMTDRPLPIIVNNDCYIEIFNGMLRGYDLGDLAKRSGYDGRLDLFDALTEFPIVYRTENLESEKTYHLESGDISIADAVKSANKCLSELTLSSREVLFKPSVQSVNVIDIGDGCFAFCFAIVTEYKQVKFNAIEMDNTTYGVSPLSDATKELDFFGVALMYEADKLTRYRMLSPFNYSDVVETGTYSNIIPLEKATEITSNHLTNGINFKALSVTAVYKTFSDKDSTQYSDDEAYRYRKINISPCWRFVLQPTTGATNKLYYVYVNMLTGKAYTSVQLMESSVEYD